MEVLIIMHKSKFSTKKLTLSSMVIALYVVIMYFTQTFAFGQYQIRIATSLYSLAYFFPYLVIPLGLANFISNIIGGMGILDMIGGCIVGIITSGIIVIIKKLNISKLFVFLPIVLIPGLCVPIWLSKVLSLPYIPLAVSLCIGQIVPAIVGVILIKSLEPILTKSQ